MNSVYLSIFKLTLFYCFADFPQIADFFCVYVHPYIVNFPGREKYTEMGGGDGRGGGGHNLLIINNCKRRLDFPLLDHQ
jgi:hypothetical protein